MLKIILSILSLCVLSFGGIPFSFGQVPNDLKKSVPLWFEFQEEGSKAVLKWMNEPGASNYNVGEVRYIANPSFQSLGSVSSGVDSFVVPSFQKGKTYHYRVSKATGAGFIDFGIEQPAVHQRGRCLILLDNRFTNDLETEIATWIGDITGDGWTVDTLWIDRTSTPIKVKEKIQSWYRFSYTMSQSVILFGNIPVPYSGSTAIDGHPDHAGAWASDTYYADVNGSWTDINVNVTTATRQENRNIPGDGKFDNVVIPSDLEIEIGRIDFSNLPAFSASEKDLLRNYLNKNHVWRRGLNPYPNKALVENNFPSFEEGFGQSGWRNFVPMFGENNVVSGDYEVALTTEKHLFTYACGPGSYTSCGGIGTTQNLWAAKQIKTVFTMTFGSYFGDWDSQNNFLKAALASGDVLANAWAGRPVWMLQSMASGAHIGFGTRWSQNANVGFFFSGNGARFTHVALLGDPTLRLHPVPSVSDLAGEEIGGVVKLSWNKGDENHNTFAIYMINEGNVTLLDQVVNKTSYEINCLVAGKDYRFMVKPVILTKTASGSYFNTGTGELVNVKVNNSNVPTADFTSNVYYERVAFDNKSIQAMSYKWDFGDGAVSSELSPVHVYSLSGKYTACLAAENSGCPKDTSCREITVISSLPEQVSAVFKEPACHGTSDGGIMLFLTGGQPSELEYLWSNGASQKDLANVPAGVYTIKLKSKISDKELQKSFTLDQPDSLKIDVNTTPSSGNNGTVTLTVNGGVPPYSYVWDTSKDWNMLPPGEYRITVTDSNGCMKVVVAKVDMSSGLDAPQTVIKMYPVPVLEVLNIEMEPVFEKLFVIDMKGHILISMDTKGKRAIQADCRHLTAGTYVVMLTSKENNVVTRCFVKANIHP